MSSSVELCNGCGEVLSGVVYEVKKHRDEPTFAIIGRDCCFNASGRHSVYPYCYLVLRCSQENLAALEALVETWKERGPDFSNSMRVYAEDMRADLAGLPRPVRPPEEEEDAPGEDEPEAVSAAEDEEMMIQLERERAVPVSVPVSAPAPAPAPAPVQTWGHVNLVRSYYTINSVDFKPAFWPVPIPADGIFKPQRATEFFWPATRVRNMAKAVDPKIGRQSFDKNIRFLAERLRIEPDEVLRTNPVLIGRRLGVSDAVLSKFIVNYSRLSQGCNY